MVPLVVVILAVVEKENEFERVNVNIIIIKHKSGIRVGSMVVLVRVVLLFHVSPSWVENIRGAIVCLNKRQGRKDYDFIRDMLCREDCFWCFSIVSTVCVFILYIFYMKLMNMK